jgi:hypothetical protein
VCPTYTYVNTTISGGGFAYVWSGPVWGPVVTTGFIGDQQFSGDALSGIIHWPGLGTGSGTVKNTWTGNHLMRGFYSLVIECP